MNIAAFCLAYAGFAALCAGMDRHCEELFDRALPRRWRASLRTAGVAALACSLYASIQAWGWSYGAVEWVGILILAGLVLIWVLAYWPVAAAVAGGVCALAGMACVLQAGTGMVPPASMLPR